MAQGRAYIDQISADTRRYPAVAGGFKYNPDNVDQLLPTARVVAV
jgi:hypothetical protein